MAMVKILKTLKKGLAEYPAQLQFGDEPEYDLVVQVRDDIVDAAPRF